MIRQTFVFLALSIALLEATTPIKSVKSLTSARINMDEVCTDELTTEFIFHPNSCSEYIFCHPFVDPIFLECDEGMLFSSIAQDCVPAAESDCIENFRCPARGTSFVGHPTDCESYLLCYNGRQHTRSCPSNLRFDRFRGSCDVAERVDCVNCLGSDSRNLTFVPSEISCDLGYFCDNGFPMPIRCGTDMQWNPEVNQCDIAANVNCQL